jgi:protease-4
VPYLAYPFRLLTRWLGNLLRRLRKAPEYVTFTLEEPYPEMVPPRPPFPKRFLSPRKACLRDLARELRHVAYDRRVKGVVLKLCSAPVPLAQAQSLRSLIIELREAGKRVIVWSNSYDLHRYLLASAADEILLQFGGTVALLGVSQSYLFLADALERIGLKGDYVQISPYKTASDILTRNDMSEEAREMADWLADDLLDQYVRTIAEGRGVSEEDVRALIEGGLVTGRRIEDSGVIDAVLNEEHLPDRLSAGKRPARLVSYAHAKKKLLKPPLPMPGKAVALLRIAGDIVEGRSAVPPVRPPFRIPLLFSERAGDLTVVQQARGLVRDRRVGAVVVYVESGGGSMWASEAMSAALREVAKKKPVVVSMGNVAASGGYYVATPGTYILAQPGTITGSIGVIAGKLINAGLYEKIPLHREVIARGEHAEYFAGSREFSDEERGQLAALVHEAYDLFLVRVSESRDLTKEAVDTVAGGRVWTGRQALEHSLVDELGGLDRAIGKAREIADLHPRARVYEVKTPKKDAAPIGGQVTSLLTYAADVFRCFRSTQALYLCPLVPWEEDL